MTLDSYAEEIDSLYSSQISAESVIPDTVAKELHSVYSDLTAVESVVPDTIKGMVLEAIRQFVRGGVKPLVLDKEASDTQNLFYSVLDSLKAIELKELDSKMASEMLGPALNLRSSWIPSTSIPP